MINAYNNDIIYIMSFLLISNLELNLKYFCVIHNSYCFDNYCVIGKNTEFLQMQKKKNEVEEK